MVETPTDNAAAQSEQDHFFNAAKVVAMLTMVSRVLGLVRDVALVPLGAPMLADAFWTAFRIPHLFRRLFGEGALSAAFVPVFAESAETNGWDRARAVLANTAGILSVVLAVLVGLIELALAGWLMIGAGGLKEQWTLEFTMLMLPFTFFICLLALCSSALNARGHFAYPAAAPIILNVGLILFARVVAPAVSSHEVPQFRVLAVGLVISSVVQLAGALWLLRTNGLAQRWNLRPVLPEIRQIARRMAPIVLPLGLVQFGDLLMSVIALSLTRTDASPLLPLMPGVVRCQYVAGRLYQLPLGVLAVSIATAVFPLMSRCTARGDTTGLRDTINRALRLCLFLGIPAGAALAVLAEPTISLIFERRDFTAFDSSRTAAMLQMYCLGMPAYFCTHILLRAFFARKETRTPMISAIVVTVLSLVMVVLGIYTPLRSASLGLATALTAILNVAWLLWVLHRRIGKLGLRSLLKSTARTLAASLAMSGGILLALWGLGLGTDQVVALLPSGPWAARAAGVIRLIPLIGAVGVGAVVFLLTAKALGCRELGELRRKRKSDNDPAPAV